MADSVYAGLTDEEKRARESERRKRSRQRNREQIIAARKRYHAENLERIREKGNAYYAANRERMKEKAREHYAKTSVPKTLKPKNQNPKRTPVSRKQYLAEYYRKNREVLSAKKKQYHKDCPDLHRRRNSKRRAVKRNATIGDQAEIVAWEKNWRSKKTVTCHWCSKRIKTSDAHVDHVVPLSKGGNHSVENFCVSCETCNLSKHNKLPEVWNSGLSQPLLFV